MNKYRFVEILCVIFAVLFIAGSLRGDATLDMTAYEITENICSQLCTELSAGDRDSVRERLGFDPDSFSSFSYYSSDDIMNVREIFIGVSPENTDSTVSEAIRKYLDEKHKLFEGYAPEEAALLKNARIEEKGNVIIFIVAENADEIYSAFLELF